MNTVAELEGKRVGYDCWSIVVVLWVNSSRKGMALPYPPEKGFGLVQDDGAERGLLVTVGVSGMAACRTSGAHKQSS